MDKANFVSNHQSVAKASDTERFNRGQKCQVCEQLQGDYIGAENRWESDDKKKDCSVEKCPAFWYTQFKDAKCPLNKW